MEYAQAKAKRENGIMLQEISNIRQKAATFNGFFEYAGQHLPMIDGFSGDTEIMPSDPICFGATTSRNAASGTELLRIYAVEDVQSDCNRGDFSLPRTIISRELPLTPLGFGHYSQLQVHQVAEISRSLESIMRFCLQSPELINRERTREGLKQIIAELLHPAQ